MTCVRNKWPEHRKSLWPPSPAPPHIQAVTIVSQRGVASISIWERHTVITPGTCRSLAQLEQGFPGDLSQKPCGLQTDVPVSTLSDSIYSSLPSGHLPQLSSGGQISASVESGHACQEEVVWPWECERRECQVAESYQGDSLPRSA